MKWYDYTMCFLCADMLSAGIFSGNIFLLTMGWLLFSIYQDIRKTGFL